MNQNVIMAMLAAFLVPIGFVVCWNFDQLVLGVDPDARPEGTLHYFYADS